MQEHLDMHQNHWINTVWNYLIQMESMVHQQDYSNFKKDYRMRAKSRERLKET